MAIHQQCLLVAGRDFSITVTQPTRCRLLTSLQLSKIEQLPSDLSTKMFRLGLRLVNSYGERVLEGVTEPFHMKERRLEGYEKHYPPMLDHEVWRLKKIGKIGAYHQALSDRGINSVQKFLQAYMKDEQKLIQIFNKMPQSTWELYAHSALGLLRSLWRLLRSYFKIVCSFCMGALPL